MLLPIPFGNPYTYAGHSGVDFPGRAGTPVPASGPGRIAAHRVTPRGGNIVWVEYDGFRHGIGYAHGNTFSGLPKPGSRINYGDTVAYMGYSGHTVPPGPNGSHTHVENSGNATEAGFWQVFDRNRVVGQGSSAGEEEKGPFMSLSSAEQREMLNLLRDVQNRIRGPIEQPYDMLQGISGSTNNIQRIQGGNLSSENQVALFQNVEVIRALTEGFEPVAITDAQIKAIAEAVAAQIGVPEVAIDYDRIAGTVREKFSSNPLK